MTSREDQLSSWLEKVLGITAPPITPASSDASFRRYFRVPVDDYTLIVMDAPPSHENCEPFIHAARVFADAGLHVPRVLEQDLQQGFLLLSDLGSTTYLAAMQSGETDVNALYGDAYLALVKLQLTSRDGEFPPYDEALLTRELQLFPDWYVARHLQVELSSEQQESLQTTFDLLNRNILGQPQVYVHRDYHSRNLMVYEPNPGILDFQDAVFGAITYDLVSLLKDAYVKWEEEQILDWAIRYWQAARKAGLPVASDFADFYRDFEWMGVQRHLKVLGIFARLYHRDGKDGYLRDMPLVMHHLYSACTRYSELRPLVKLLDQLQGKQPVVGYTF